MGGEPRVVRLADRSPTKPGSLADVQPRQHTAPNGDGETAEAEGGGTAAQPAEEEPAGGEGVGAEEEAPETPVRALSEWQQTEVEQLLEGKAEGVAVRSDGALMLSPRMTVLHKMIHEFAAWSLAADDTGHVYFGVGNTGKVYKAVPGGEAEELLDTGELAVHSLINDGHGNLLAGTVPNGKIFRIPLADPAQARVLCETGESYVWAMLPDGDGGCFAGTGSHGRLLHVTAAGEVSVLAVLPAQHVLCLARDEDKLYAGTSEEATVCCVALSGEYEPLYESDDMAICSIAVSPRGEVYASTSPTGMVHKIVPGQPTRTIYKSEEQAVLSLCFLGDTLYGGTAGEGLILMFLDDDTVATLADIESVQITALAPVGDGAFAAGSANNCRVMLFDVAGEATGQYDSAVLDAAREAAWSSLWWEGEVPEGTALRVRTRTGTTSDPADGTWGAWSAAYERPGRYDILSGAARFIQYHLDMAKPAAAASPVLRALGILYLPANSRPTVKVEAPLPGAAISGTYELSWVGSDDDGDKLRCNLETLAAGAGEWQMVASDIEDSSYEWDTSELADGVYALRATVSDEMANPGAPLTHRAEVPGLVVDNTAPRLWLEAQPAISPEGTVAVHGQAADDLTLLRVVEFETGDGKWRPARPGDSAYDARTEMFSFTTAALDPGEHTITVRAVDAAGNHKTLPVDVTIEGQAAVSPH